MRQELEEERKKLEEEKAQLARDRELQAGFLTAFDARIAKVPGKATIPKAFLVLTPLQSVWVIKLWQLAYNCVVFSQNWFDFTLQSRSS